MQVWCNRKLVGEAHIAVPPGESGHSFPIMPEIPMVTTFAPADFDVDAAISKIHMPIAKRAVRISDFEILKNYGDISSILEVHNVPEEADESISFETSARTYSWRVFEVSPEVFEQIFDMDWFVPADTREPDPELYQRRLAGMV